MRFSFRRREAPDEETAPPAMTRAEYLATVDRGWKQIRNAVSVAHPSASVWAASLQLPASQQVAFRESLTEAWLAVGPHLESLRQELEATTPPWSMLRAHQHLITALQTMEASLRERAEVTESPSTEAEPTRFDLAIETFDRVLASV